MVKQDRVPSRVSFRLDDESLDQLEELSVKLRLGQSEVLRIAVKRLIESYGGPESDILVIDKEKFDSITDKFMQRIEGEPKRQKEVMEKFGASLVEKLKKEGVLK